MRKIELYFVIAGTALLGACATPQTTTDASGEKFKVPIGYSKTMVKGQEEYCRTDVDTGSRVSRTTTCYTAAQLQSQASDTQSAMQQQMMNSNQLGTGVGAGGPTNGR